MGRKCFISCKTEDFDYKNAIQKLDIDMIDKSLNEAIDSDDEDYIMKKIRADYLSDSTVTLHLIGPYSNDNLGWKEQKYIKRELQGSLYNGKGNTRNGILGIVLPSMYANIYRGDIICARCRLSHRYISLDSSTTISEFSYNYYIPNDKCSHSEADRYCVLVKWDEFLQAPDHYIELAFLKRTQDIANKVKVRP